MLATPDCLLRTPCRFPSGITPAPANGPANYCQHIHRIIYCPACAFDKRVGRRSFSAEYKAFTSFRVRCFSHKTRTFLDGNGLYPFHITLSALWKNPQTRVRYSGIRSSSPHFSSMPNSSEVVRTMSNPHASSDGLTKSG